MNLMDNSSNTSLDWVPLKQGGVSHCGLAIYIKKYLKAKRRITEIQIFHHAKI